MENINKTGWVWPHSEARMGPCCLCCLICCMLSHKLESESLDDSKRSGSRLTNLDMSNVTRVNETMRQLHLHGWKTTAVVMALKGTEEISAQRVLHRARCRAVRQPPRPHQRGDTQRLWWAASSQLGHSPPSRRGSWHLTSSRCHIRFWLLACYCLTLLFIM